MTTLYLFFADFVDWVVHDGDQGIEEDDNRDDQVEGEHRHGNVSRHCWIVLFSAPEIFNGAGVKNIPEQNFENDYQTIQLYKNAFNLVKEEKLIK